MQGYINNGLVYLTSSENLVVLVFFFLMMQVHHGQEIKQEEETRAAAFKSEKFEDLNENSKTISEDNKCAFYW